MRLLASKDGDLKSYLDKTDGNRYGNKGSSLNKRFTNNHEKVADRRKIKGLLPLD